MPFGLLFTFLFLTGILGYYRVNNPFTNGDDSFNPLFLSVASPVRASGRWLCS